MEPDRLPVWQESATVSLYAIIYYEVGVGALARKQLLLATARESCWQGPDCRLAATAVEATSLASFPLQPAGGIVARHGAAWLAPACQPLPSAVQPEPA
ncbi:hypothetical protein VTN96DRAFT_3089 [Rasamsonia emersonii]